ncbi:MAG: ROK family protein [Cyanobacteria bacterium]|nr:ROK family protein [Cyanobacteria bacterium CG_2015-16_32_12]NCO77556.1 ROK family protein [Cyanobacteria bacterium CG_2015-22_32_23]NCQ03465.1 ROK family protein [Cyanobacteria bacterium CG_2015-09_32_10]NCQ40876.1 ROK family protein [Cyanobacteria bacterium CG_2015-04_32_10]NCS84811.1 ROK family protein [Cyanobacteria bacterium CG_2015-02_32_10]
MTEKEVIGVDLGGTAIKLGRFLENGTCLESVTIPTPNPATPEAVIDAIANTVLQLNSNKKAVALGIGTPGPADVHGRIALVAINLSGWHNVALADELEKKTGLKTVIANDANCAGLGEAWLGAGKNYQNLIMLTLGTGVGGAIILDGKLFTGRLGSAAELGLITLNPEGHPCNSGNQGSLEQYVSATAIYRDTKKTPAELGQLAENNNHEALTFWKNYGKQLAYGLASLIYILTPEVIIIGGGVCGSSKFFLPSTEAEINRRVLESSRIGLKLMVAELGNQAGMVGAAKLAWQQWVN